MCNQNAPLANVQYLIYGLFQVAKLFKHVGRPGRIVCWHAPSSLVASLLDIQSFCAFLAWHY
jgi:hypothetical protein